MKAQLLPVIVRRVPELISSGARLLGWVGAAGVLFVPAVAQAQATDGEFSVQRFDPAPGPRNYFSVRGVRTDGEMSWSGGLVVNYAYLPFVVRSCQSETNCSDPNATQQDVNVVENMVTGVALASLTPIPRLQIGLSVPVTWVKGQGLTESGLGDPAGLSAVGLGDAQLEGKFRLSGAPDDPFVAGVGAFVTGPLGHATAKGNYLGDQTPTAGLRGIFDGAAGPLTVGGNLAALYRGDGRVGSTTLGPEFRYGIGVGFNVSPVLRIVVEDYGATKFSSKNGTNSMEIDGGIQVTPLDSPFVIQAGAGTGLIQGIGVPRLRAFLGVMYVHEGGDRDQDGITDHNDACPDEAGVASSNPSLNGCPATDRDGDGIPDDRDRCPTEPGGAESADGCPIRDTDKDGIPDDRDQCPNEPETKNGYKDDDGCPDEPDSDRDGVPDSRDQCPNEPEDTDGFDDTDGCPDPDNDSDGVPDEKDQCDGEPETWNGFEDDDGCPDTPPKGFKPPKGWEEQRAPFCEPGAKPGRTVCIKTGGATEK
ncbi:MAG: thrombospondin type 3 repeat-containing protein [Sorangiineae bacterium]|nr:thrombospondin type 3 repeat-containing protein [Polyangiaceae bacterium]MEB2322400.1 thrombospondin type 3 repeat-containing protein [Sorangiineae bacterium]